jgi:RNA polymerase sigma factor (sigma-70 family)
VNDTMRRNPCYPRQEKAAYPDRTNPCRPSRDRDSDRSTDRRKADASYPPQSKCDPRPPKTPLNDDQRGLTVRYLPLAQALAHKSARSCPAGRDEFQSAAFLALVEAAQAFDPSRKVDFAVYARHRIRGALADVRRELFHGGWRGQTASAPRFQSLEPDSESRGRVVGIQAGEPVGAELETADVVENWLNKLSPRHSSAFRHVYLDGKTLEEAAAIVGCSKSSMSRLRRDTLTWFQQVGWRSSAEARSEPLPSPKTEPIATAPENGCDRILASWSLRSRLKARPQAFFGVAS